jgi:Domain of unknown function (DUF4159)
MKRATLVRMTALLLVLGGGIVFAQFRGGGRRNRFGGDGSSFYDEHGDLFTEGGDPDSHLPPDRHGTPDWTVDPQFKSDLFTFVRIKYHSAPYRIHSWITDFPDSDLNFSFRLQQMTSLKVANKPIILDLEDPRIMDYPFIYMLEVGGLEFTDAEITALRHYLLNGGFLMIDDHWGLDEQENWREQIERVFPDHKMVELTLDHPIFHCVFDLKKLPQVPGISRWRQFQRQGDFNRTWEQTDDIHPHYRAIYDDKGRMMLLECANTDMGDGWEREGEEEEYFHKFSETQAYPMGINIVFYAMTH